MCAEKRQEGVVRCAPTTPTPMPSNSHTPRALQSPHLHTTDARAGRLVRAEKRQEGVVPWAVYGRYLHSLGWVSSLAVLFMLLGGQACSVASDWWLANWARASNQGDLQ